MSQELNGTLTNSANLVGTFGSTQGGTTNYNDLVNKPSINHVELVGNKSGSQLGLVSDTDLSTVAFSGNYNDLMHKPTIPAAQVNSDWNSTTGVSAILNKPTIPTKTSDLTNDSGFVEASDLSTVATTGDYDDLTNKPTIPAAQVNSDWNSTTGVSEILNKPTLSTVATSGSYNDLTDKPTLSGTAIINDPTSDPDETIASKISAVEGSIPTLSEVTTGFSPETGTTVVGFKASKLGGMITISATLQPTFSAVGNKDIGTLPEGYRPSGTVRFVAGNTSKDTQINATITSAGLVSVYATSQNVNLSAQNIAFCVTFT